MEQRPELEESLIELQLELEEEKANVAFLSSGSFLALEKRLKREIERFLEVIYNQGKPEFTEEEMKKVNAARVEVSVRRDFLKRIYESPERVVIVERDIQEIKQQLK